MADSSSLRPGLTHTQMIAVDERLLVPAMAGFYTSFGTMPQVFATAYMVGFIEWACIELINPYLGAEEDSVGTHVDVSHVAATPSGMTVRAEVELVEVSGRKLRFRVRCFDDAEPIGEGFHERAIIHREKFAGKIARKRDQHRVGA
jgi:fluoroacetyl-CoA thioesterase